MEEGKTCDCLYNVTKTRKIDKVVFVYGNFLCKVSPPNSPHFHTNSGVWIKERHNRVIPLENNNSEDMKVN